MTRVWFGMLAFAMCVLAACTSGTPEPEATGSTDEPPSVTLEARGVPLLDGERRSPLFAIESAERSANVIVTAYRARDRSLPLGRRRAPAGLRVSLCPITSVDDGIRSEGGCRTDIGLGVREPVSSSDFAGFALVTTGAAPDVLADVVIQYPEGGRAVSITLPVVRGPLGGTDCSDNGCNPFVELRPTRNGRLQASASWAGPQATLVLLQGNITGRAQTATGIPYREAAVAHGSSPLQIDSQMSAPGEYALALRHRNLRPGEPALRSVRIDAEWP